MKSLTLRAWSFAAVSVFAFALGGTVPFAASAPPMELQEALTAAIEDEFKSRAIYRKVLEKHGDVRPFVNVVEAEGRHIQALERSFAGHGFPVPPDEWPSRVAVPATLLEACKEAVAAERANVKLYDDLLAGTRSYPDVQRVFGNLQRASREKHLPAFERCVTRGGAGRGPGRGGAAAPAGTTTH